MITTCFARAAQRWTSRICVHVLFTFQEVTPISKTRNQLKRHDVAVWQERAESHARLLLAAQRRMIGA